MFCLKVDSNENFCAAATLHATSQEVYKTHVLDFTEQLKSKALTIGKRDIFKFIHTRRCSKWVFYHKKCLTCFNNRYRDALLHDKKNSNFEMELQKQVRLKQVASYILEQRTIDPKHKFELTFYDSMYKELLDIDSIPYCCQSFYQFWALSSYLTSFQEVRKN